MSDVKQCDICKKVADAPYCWWKVERLNSHGLIMWAEPDSWDFCSFLCMEVLVEQQRQREGGPETKP